MRILGASFLSPLSIVLMIDRRAFDTTVISSEDATEAEAFVASPRTDPDRLRVGVVVEVDMLRSATLRPSLAKLDRIVVLDTPDALDAVGIRNLSAAKAGNGSWTLIRQSVEYYTSALAAGQDVASDLASLRVQPRKDTSQELLGDEGAEGAAVVKAAVGLLCGVSTKKDFDEAAKAALSAGVTPRLIQGTKDSVLKAYRQPGAKVVRASAKSVANLSAEKLGAVFGLSADAALKTAWALSSFPVMFDGGSLPDGKLPRKYVKAIEATRTGKDKRADAVAAIREFAAMVRAMG